MATVKLNEKDISAPIGTFLSEIVKGEKPCGGHGKCGKCKVIAKGQLSAVTETEKALLTADERARGVRLSCLTTVAGDCEIVTESGNGGCPTVASGSPVHTEINSIFSEYGVALDIGTTTLVAQLYDVRGNKLAETARLNPQTEWGGDVVSRIEAALDGKASLLAKTIRTAIDEMIAELAVLAAIDAKCIDGIVITGNTVMLYLLTEESVVCLSRAPFEAMRLFGENLPASELGLSSLLPNTRVYLPPCISAFVGADIVCDLLTIPMDNEAVLLVDIGTNGEMALWNGQELFVCSTAAGPAFEGVGISMGMRGVTGAIDKVNVSNGKLDTHVIGDGEPIGICGSGLIDAVACMLETETLDESGYLENAPFVICEPVCFTQTDVRMVQLAKSAICAGIETLLAHACVAGDALSRFVIAGGFGTYMDVNNAIRIGLFPNTIPAERVYVLGNGAISGAVTLLLDRNKTCEALRISREAHVVELATNAVFQERYMQNMLF